MAKMNGLDKMSYAELSELRDQVDAAMIVAQANEKKELRAEMEAIAAKAGLTLAEILSSKRGSSMKGSKVAIKYRNPKDADETWTGRGRKPNWLTTALKKGQKIESFLI